MSKLDGRYAAKGSRRGRSKFTERSTASWGIRAALAIGLAIAGSVGTSNSLARVIKRVDPARALALAPTDGIILAAYAQDAFSKKPEKDTNSSPAILADRAVLADPTAAEALTVLGSQAQLRGDAKRAARIFYYSTLISRRELRPQLWAIEEAVTRGDIAGALRNYDIALRTSNDAERILFPTLVAGLAEPKIRAALQPILATDPVWGDRFVAFAANSGVEPEGTIALFQEGQGTRLDQDENLRASLVNSLVAQGKQNEAWDYYRSFHPNARRDESRDPFFAVEARDRAVFDWQAASDPRISAAILRQRNNVGVLDFSVPPSVSGELVRQGQLLPAGRYRIEGTSEGIDQKEDSRPYWLLTCEDGRSLGRVQLSNSEENGGRFFGHFIVPHDCKAQTLSLIARSTDDIMGINGQIISAKLVSER